MLLPVWTWKLLRSRGFKIAIASVPVVLGLFAAGTYAYLNAKGGREAASHLASLAAQGQALSLEQYLLPSPAPSDDIFEVPEVRDELNHPTFGRIAGLGPHLPGLATRPPRYDWIYGKTFTVTDWLAAPSTATDAEAARKILALLAPRDALWETIREGLKRPAAAWSSRRDRDPVSGELISFVSAPFMGMRYLSDHASDRALLHLATGDSPAAVAEVETIIRLIRHLHTNHPAVIFHLVGVANMNRLYPVILNGAMSGAWTEADLSILDRLITSLDPQKSAVASLRGELAFLAPQLRNAMENSPSRGRLALSKGWQLKWDQVSMRLYGIWRLVRPYGLDLMRDVELQRGLVDHGLHRNGKPRTRFDAAELPGFEPPTLWSYVVVPMHGSAFQTSDSTWQQTVSSLAQGTLRCETLLSLSRTGIALERYRIAHGSYPSDLQGLVPAYLPGVLADPYDGKPLRYRLQPYASPLVWSVGLDQLDEGGLPHSRPDKGDIIWLTRPLTGFTRKVANR